MKGAPSTGKPSWERFSQFFRNTSCLLAIAGALGLGQISLVLAQPASRQVVDVIDLPTALRLAGAQNLDVQIVREHFREAEANRLGAIEQFFPWVAPGLLYHRRDGLAQAVPAGTISDAHFDSYSPGATIAAQVAIGDAVYQSIAAKQLLHASEHALEAERQAAILSAAEGYFELAKATALVDVNAQAVHTSEMYQQELHSAVASGIAFKGDELRVQSRSEHYQLQLRQAVENQRTAAVNLAKVLHLDPAVDLRPRDSGLTRLTLIETNAALAVLIEQALRTRPELEQARAQVAASRAVKNGAIYGPLIPSLGAQVFAGGLGGGPDGGPARFGAEEDYLVGVNWRIGPGGLFDAGRIRAGKARLAAMELTELKLRDSITSQVVIGLARIQSLSDQIGLAEQSLSSTSETLRLTRERKQYGVGVVLEEIQAEQDVTQVRSDYISALAEFNKAQYVLSKAIGGIQDHAPVAPPREKAASRPEQDRRSHETTPPAIPPVP